MPNIPKAKKKLRECAFFFRHLTGLADRMPHLDSEEFDFYLSAFLSSARSVTFVLQTEDGARYKSWFPAWNAVLDDSDRNLLKFMNEQRVAEVHMQGASVEQKIEMVPVTEIGAAQRPSHPAYGIHSFVPPDNPPPTVGMQVAYFEREGNPETAVNTCRIYLQLLQRLIADFEKP